MTLNVLGWVVMHWTVAGETFGQCRGGIETVAGDVLGRVQRMH
jgi:hypothetical protein